MSILRNIEPRVRLIVGLTRFSSFTPSKMTVSHDPYGLELEATPSWQSDDQLTYTIVRRGIIILVPNGDLEYAFFWNILDAPNFVPYGGEGVRLYRGTWGKKWLSLPSFKFFIIGFSSHISLILSSIVATKYGSAVPMTSILGNALAPINVIVRSTRMCRCTSVWSVGSVAACLARDLICSSALLYIMQIWISLFSKGWKRKAHTLRDGWSSISLACSKKQVAVGVTPSEYQVYISVRAGFRQELFNRRGSDKNGLSPSFGHCIIIIRKRG